MRETVLRASLAEVERHGISGYRIEAVAEAAGVSRATLYRHFAGGKAAVLAATVEAEVRSFWIRVASVAVESVGIENRLVVGLMTATRLIREHSLLHDLLQRDAAMVLPMIEAADRSADDALRRFLRGLILDEPPSRIRPGLDEQEAAGYLAVMCRSIVGNPAGWNMDDADDVRRLVRAELLGGILAT